MAERSLSIKTVTERPLGREVNEREEATGKQASFSFTFQGPLELNFWPSPLKFF